MSSFNVLSDSEKNQFLSGSWYPAVFNTNGVKFGTPYALSVTYDSSADGLWFQTRFNYWTTDGKIRALSDTALISCAKGKHSATVTIPSFDKPDDFAKAVFMVQAGDISGKGTIEISRPMLVEGDTPAAWAPAEGETLAGGGAQMSANLLDGITPNHGNCQLADGVLTSVVIASGWYNVGIWPVSLDAVTENQTLHLGASVRWHGEAAKSGTAYMSVKYADAAGNINNINVALDGIAAEWRRISAKVVLPSGMRIVDFHTSANMLDAAYDLTAPTLSLGSPVTLAIASATLAWSAGIVAVTRYYKLASATSSTPSVPASSSALNGWSETEPTADVTKVLWVCERTVYADGSESWSKASKSTSYEAAKDAKSTANAAKGVADSANSKADNLSTLIHEGDDGITVGKSADGKTWSTGRTRMTADAYQILDKLGTVITQLASDGASFLSGLVRIVAGKATLPGNKTVNSIVIDAGDGVAALHGIISRLDATINGIKSSVSAGWEQDFGCGVTAIVMESATVSSAAYLASDKAELHVGDNHVTMTGGSFDLSNPEYLTKELLSESAVASDLNTCGPGVFEYNTDTANRPSNYGMCVSFRTQNGNWLFQLALPTAGDPHWRRNINGAGWEGWRQWATS